MIVLQEDGASMWHQQHHTRLLTHVVQSALTAKHQLPRWTPQHGAACGNGFAHIGHLKDSPEFFAAGRGTSSISLKGLCLHRATLDAALSPAECKGSWLRLCCLL